MIYGYGTPAGPGEVTSWSRAHVVDRLKILYELWSQCHGGGSMERCTKQMITEKEKNG